MLNQNKTHWSHRLSSAIRAMALINYLGSKLNSLTWGVREETEQPALQRSTGNWVVLLKTVVALGPIALLCLAYLVWGRPQEELEQGEDGPLPASSREDLLMGSTSVKTSIPVLWVCWPTVRLTLPDERQRHQFLVCHSAILSMPAPDSVLLLDGCFTDGSGQTPQNHLRSPEEAQQVGF